MTKSAASAAQRNLGLGYATPIIGAVTALLTGLIVVDITHTNLDIWIWVLIEVILGTGMILGTRFATSAFNYSLDHAKKVGATRGARNLNLILGIIWSATVILLSFAKAGEAVQGMVHWPKQVVTKNVVAPTPVPPTIDPFTSVKFWEDFLPAFVLIVIAVVGIYLLLSERSREAKKPAAE